jgi:hypothetical protein
MSTNFDHRPQLELAEAHIPSQKTQPFIEGEGSLSSTER